MIAVAMKWAPLLFEVDPLTAVVSVHPRSIGVSAADEAALEWGLRLGELWGEDVLVVCAGPPEAEAMLATALAAGAARAVRVEAASGSSMHAAAALAPVVSAASVVVCGDRSADRASGAVPPLLAAHLDAAQACGLVALVPVGVGVLEAERRLNGGRREHLRVEAPAVVSVEAATARLRRAPLASVLARRRPEFVAGGAQGGNSHDPLRPVHRAPFRPRPQPLPGPDQSATPFARVGSLYGNTETPKVSKAVTLEPAQAAEVIIEALRSWGYLPPS